MLPNKHKRPGLVPGPGWEVWVRKDFLEMMLEPDLKDWGAGGK